MTGGTSDATDPLRDLGPESLEDLYEHAPCGYLIVRPDGIIARANQTFLDWAGYAGHELVGTQRFARLLARGGRIFYETHFAPLLSLQGEVRELAFDLARLDGTTLPILVSARRVPATDLVGAHDRITVFDATQRHQYETELLQARKAAEASEQQMRTVAQTLQRSLLSGGVERGPGFAVATRYRPAVDTLEIGGDWHDAFVLNGGSTVAVSVGDVVGRGITAACAMGQLRSALRAIAGSGTGPAAVLDQLDDFVDRLPDAQLATIAYAEIDVASGLVRYACAGHLPPLVVHPAGTAEYLWGGRSRPIGSTSGPRPEATTTLAPGSRFALYTDGLIERRARDIDRGLDALRDAAAERVSLPLAELVDGLMADLLADEEHPDDVCLLVHERR